MNKAAIAGLVLICVVLFGLLNDMRWQRDFWMVTADWCGKAPTRTRCQKAIEGLWPISFRPFYFRGVEAPKEGG